MEIKIRDEFIKLGQDGLVQVNGEVDQRRGRKVYEGDVITFEDQEIKVIR